MANHTATNRSMEKSAASTIADPAVDRFKRLIDYVLGVCLVSKFRKPGNNMESDKAACNRMIEGFDFSRKTCREANCREANIELQRKG